MLGWISFYRHSTGNGLKACNGKASAIKAIIEYQHVLHLPPDDLPHAVLPHGHVQKMANQFLILGLQGIDLAA